MIHFLFRKYTLLLFLVTILYSVNSIAQSTCYESLGELSGINIIQHSTELNNAACELIQTLPSQYQNDFKVFDFGYYSLNETMDTGVEDIWTTIKSKAQANSTYYLLFGKVSGENGIYHTYLVDAVLPPILDEDCGNNISRKISEIRVILNSNTNPALYAQKEIEAMQVLKNYGTCEICDDDIDNDGDGLVDCDDFDCMYLQLSSNLKGNSYTSQKRSSSDCVVLTQDEIDIFFSNEEYIVGLGFESSAEVIEEIEALSIAQCIVGAIVSIGMEYSLNWFILNLQNDNYYDYFSHETASLIFEQHGLSIAVNAGAACIETCIPLYPSRIKRAIANLGYGFATGFVEAVALEFNKHLELGCSLTETILTEMDWGQVFDKAIIQAVVSMIVNDISGQISPIIVNSFNANKSKVIDRIKKGIGPEAWIAIKKIWISESTDAIEDAINKLSKHFDDNGLGTHWDDFLNDFGNKLNDLEWFVLKMSKRVDAWLGIISRPKWVRTNKGLIGKITDKPNLKSKVNEYYENAIPSNTPSGFNGEGVYSGVKFNKYGHPELKPHVSHPSHIIDDLNPMLGNYTSDFTNAKNKLVAQAFGGDASKVRKAIDPVTGNPASGWSPFQIKQADGSWSQPYTWHHHQNGKSMYPVKKSVHDAIIGKHTGGREIVNSYPELIGFFNEP